MEGENYASIPQSTSVRHFADCGVFSLVSAQEAVHQTVNMSLPLWSIIPFVALLLSVALVPLVNGLWWRKNEKWVALFWSVAFLVPFSYIYGWQEGLERFLEAVLLDFVPFIILLFGLFATAGASWWTDVWRAHRRRMR